MGALQRVAVEGNCGGGKSTLARALATRLGGESIELDTIHHLPDWTPIDREEMRRIVSARMDAHRSCGHTTHRGRAHRGPILGGRRQLRADGG